MYSIRQSKSGYSVIGPEGQMVAHFGEFALQYDGARISIVRRNPLASARDYCNWKNKP